MISYFLLDDFYTVNTLHKTDATITANIQLNVSHAIFKGHFEQMPVVPGVCQTQIIKELLQKELNKSLILTTGDNIKFTGMIIPTQHPSIQLEVYYKIDGNSCFAEAKLFFENSIFTKFKGSFSIS